MPTLQILSSRPRSGKSTVAAALALGLVRQGQAVQLLRTGTSDAARHDAAAFGDLPFAASPTEPVGRAGLPAAGESIGIVELEAGEEPLDTPAILVLRGAASTEDSALAGRLGERLVGSIATLVPAADAEGLTRELTRANLKPLAVLPEHPSLAAPAVEDIRLALAADVLHEGENLRTPIDNILVAPVYTDGAKSHFPRYSGANAVFTPSYKTDLLLAALEARAACLVITGGHHPSHYVLDRALGEPVTVLLAQHQTPAAISALSDVWAAGPFSGETKAEVALSLLDSSIDWAALAGKLA